MALALVALALAGCGATSETNTLGPAATPKCAVTVSTASPTVPAQGGSGRVTVSTARECAWSAEPDAAWLSIAAGAQGQGDGAVEFVAARNPDPLLRRGGIMLNGQRVEIAQAAAECLYALSADRLEIGPDGGVLRVDVDASSRLCAWTAQSEVGWIAVSAGGAGTGSGSVELAVQPGGASARSGRVTIAGRTVDVTQAPAGPTVPTPTPDPAPNPNPAPPPNPNPTPGPGPAPPPPNPTPPPDPSPTPPPAPGPTPPPAPGPTPPNPPDCQLQLSPSSVRVGQQEYAATITVTVADGCAWSAESQDSWIRVTSGASGSGGGTVAYTIERLPGGPQGERTGRILIGDQTFTVTQVRGGGNNP